VVSGDEMRNPPVECWLSRLKRSSNLRIDPKVPAGKPADAESHTWIRANPWSRVTRIRGSLDPQVFPRVYLRVTCVDPHPCSALMTQQRDADGDEALTSAGSARAMGYMHHLLPQHEH
jgi:hypothetical protein